MPLVVISCLVKVQGIELRSLEELKSFLTTEHLSSPKYKCSFLPKSHTHRILFALLKYHLHTTKTGCEV